MGFSQHLLVHANPMVLLLLHVLLLLMVVVMGRGRGLIVSLLLLPAQLLQVGSSGGHLGITLGRGTEPVRACLIKLYREEKGR